MKQSNSMTIIPIRYETRKRGQAQLRCEKIPVPRPTRSSSISTSESSRTELPSHVHRRCWWHRQSLNLKHYPPRAWPTTCVFEFFPQGTPSNIASEVRKAKLWDARSRVYRRKDIFHEVLYALDSNTDQWTTPTNGPPSPTDDHKFQTWYDDAWNSIASNSATGSFLLSLCISSYF